ncbi:hypothetical protein [Gordonia humi]|uniref:Uncharacterized protein n=1 Tax=Gordonia humi TaxID=686429 RepID=A0A840F3L4_9ACTN|nr:hypothetical protein [Gordonia humi]MBB4134870.1 hypothetical protein [Gordonia humi]
MIGVLAAATLGAGLLVSPSPANAGPLDGFGGQGGLDLGALTEMLDDPMISQFIESCRTGGLAGPIDPDADPIGEVALDPGAPAPVAIADCTRSDGTGIALVLPESIEVGRAAENMVMDLGPDINIVLTRFTMGERNLIEILGGVVLGSDLIKGLADAVMGAPVDPNGFNEYKTYAGIQNDAALPVVMERYCDGVTILGRCLGTMRDRDKNLEKRTKALKMAEYLTGHKYDYSKPVMLPDAPGPRGSATIIGSGINIALAMRGGTAIAETGNDLALALAGADHGNTSSAFANLGIGVAVDMDTDDVRITWFGEELDMTKLLASGLLDADMVKDAMGEDASMLDMLDLVQGINGQIPGLHEVACMGLQVNAYAQGLGECANYLGTFDYYKDLRPIADGEHRQTQYGLTDVTSLFMGNDALLKQLGPVLGGDTSGLMDSPFMTDLLIALVSAEDRLKLTKDFVRYTKDIRTDLVKVQATDPETGELLFDEETGQPIMVAKTEPRMVPVMVQKTEQKLDADGEPVFEDGEPVMEPVVDANDEPVMVQATDSDGNPLFEQAKDADGEPIFDPVYTSVTAHWLTSDYGLREPLTIDWLGHQIVFFPPVEVNGTTRPNLIGLPQITKITGDAKAGLLPKIGLIRWDNPFGLGTLDLSNPFDPIGTLRNFFDSMTIVDDLKGVGELVGPMLGGGSDEHALVDGDDDASAPEDGDADTADAAPRTVATTAGQTTKAPAEEIEFAEQTEAPAVETTVEQAPGSKEATESADPIETVESEAPTSPTDDGADDTEVADAPEAVAVE